MSILAVERNQPIVLNVLMVNQIGGLPRTNLSYVDVEVWYLSVLLPLLRILLHS